jgi:photosystem II stability/assembly factor-like uncharacterized protein
VLGQPQGTPLVQGRPAPGLVGELGAVACADIHHCWAVGVPGPNATMPAGDSTVILATANGGATWTPQTVVGGYTPELSGIACPTKVDCMAVGSNGLSDGVAVVTHDGGAHWASATTPTGAIAVESVACDGLAECTALVSNGTAVWSARTNDFGQTWTQMGNLPASFVVDGSLSCLAGDACLVPGYTPTSASHGQGALALSRDGGQTWASASVPAGTGVLQAAECLSTSLCLAAGSTSTTVSDVAAAQGQLLRSVDGGTTWSAATAPPVDDTFGLACPSDRLCALVGANWSGNPAVASGAVAQSRDGGTEFTPSLAAYAPITLTAVVCPSTTACVAVGGDVVARITLVQPKASHRGSTTT